MEKKHQMPDGHMMTETEMKKMLGKGSKKSKSKKKKYARKSKY